MTSRVPRENRYCPMCSQETAAELCPSDGTPTFLRTVRQAGSQSLAIGDLVGGRYRITGILGQGGFGAVYAAEHVMTGQAAAVKVMIGDGDGLDPELVQRFLQEARITAALSHPNTVRIYDFGQTDSGVLFMAMEHLRGLTLEGRLRAAAAENKSLSEREAATIGIHVLRSLTEAHAAGLVHRDLKPANLILVQLIGEPQLVKVLDFGIARIHGSALTQAGTALGTPTYMSPEQGRAEVPDGRSDLYALGCILFTCVTGRPPFADSNPLSVLLAHQMTPLPDLRSLAKTPVSDGFIAVVQRATAKAAADRYSSAIAMREALEAVVAAYPAATSDAAWLLTQEADAIAPAATEYAEDSDPAWLATSAAEAIEAPPGLPPADDADSRPTMESDIVRLPTPRRGPPQLPSAPQDPRRGIGAPSSAERTPTSTRLRSGPATLTPRPPVRSVPPAAGMASNTHTMQGLPANSAKATAAARALLQDATPVPHSAVAGAPRPARAGATAALLAAAIAAAAIAALALWWVVAKPGAEIAAKPPALAAPASAPPAPAASAGSAAAQPALPEPKQPAAAAPPGAAAAGAPAAEPPQLPPAPADQKEMAAPAREAAAAPLEVAPAAAEPPKVAAKKPAARPARDTPAAPKAKVAPPADRKKAFDML